MNFSELLQQYGVPTAPTGHHHGRTGWEQLDCPRCSWGQKKYRLGYNVAYGYCNCWLCGSIPITEVLQAAAPELSYSDIRKVVDDLPRQRIEKPEHQGTLEYPNGVGPLLMEHKKYLISRGYEWRLLRKLWGIRGIGMSPPLSWRIFIPIHYRGEVVSWTTRTVSRRDDINRYRSASEKQEAIKHKTLLYGEDYARHAIVVVEGPFDVWKIGPGAVSTFGTGWSMAQARKMIRYPMRAICFDNEPEAQKRAKQLYRILLDFPGQTMRIELDAKDAGDASEREIRRLRRSVLR